MGLACDVVRFLQETRKAIGLDVADRITLTWAALDGSAAGAETAEAVREHAAMIADEVLAVEFAEGAVPAAVAGDEDLGLKFQITKVG